MIVTLIATVFVALPQQVNAASAVTLNLTAHTETTVSLSWTLSRDAIPGYDIIVGYELFMSSTGINGDYAKIWSTLDNQRMSTSVDGLSPGKEYCFYLIATGLSDNYRSNTVQVTNAAKADDISPNFSIRIVASINNYSSTCVFGVNPDSSVNYSSKYDSLEPYINKSYPNAGVYCYLVYYNQSSLRDDDKLAQYIVPSNGATSWVLEVGTIDESGILTLSWNDTTVSSLTLADHVYGKPYANMSEVSNVSFSWFGNAPGDFDIVYLSPTLDAVELLAASPHSIIIETPNNSTVYNSSLTLNVSVNFLASDSARTGAIFEQSLTSLNYSIDDKSAVNIFTINLPDWSSEPVSVSNVTISNLTDGQHKIVLTAAFVANVGRVFSPTFTFISEPTYFTVATGNTPNIKPPSNPEPFPWLPVAAVTVAVAAVVALAAVVYVKKYKRQT